jgi:hypothetical protein
LSNPASAVPCFDPDKKNWYKGQIHCHTLNSDGEVSPGQCVALYKAAGYDFLAISDHAETPPGYDRFVTRTEIYNNPNFMTFPNSEVSFASHMNALNTSADTIRYSPIGSLQDIIDLVLSTGASICQINHPYYSYLAPASILNTHGALLMEVLQQWDATHSYWRQNPDGSNMDGMIEDARVWDSVLTAGRQIFGTGSDDAHHYPAEINWGWIEVYATSLELNDILTAVKNGDFYASNGPEISSIVTHDRTLEVTSRDGVQVKFIGKNGVVLDSVESDAAGFTLPGTGSYVRAVVTDAGGKVAYTQAFFPDSGGGTSLGGRKKPEPAAGAIRCYPNPFNPATSFAYRVAGKGLHPVRLEIFDVKGTKIRTLVKYNQSPGEYSETWAGRDDYGSEAGSGVYLYRLVIDNKSYRGSILKIK